MSFVTTQPEALAFAAGNLQALGSAMTAENAAAAAPTTGVVPAAADEVSALQAALFSAYGTWYQQVAAEAATVHEMFTKTLGSNADSYAATEAGSTAAAGSGDAGSGGILGWLTGVLGNTGLGGISGNEANLMNIGGGNWICAASDLIGLAGGGLLPEEAGDIEAVDQIGDLPAEFGYASLASVMGPAGTAAPSAAPVTAGLSQPTANWVAPAAAPSTAPAAIPGAGAMTAAARAVPIVGMPAGAPAAATGGRLAGFGRARYGVKPTVMPRPDGV